jgi:uncharacterized protein involved in outer membrane biogenesis
MKKSTRISLWIAGVVVASMVTLGLLRNSLLGWATVRFIRASTGLEVAMDAIKVQVARPSVRILGMTVRNPPGFEAGEAIRFREIYAEYDRRALWSRRPHFRKIVIDMPNLIVVRNEKGEMNWQRISGEVSRRTQTLEAATNAPPAQEPKGGDIREPGPESEPAGPAYEIDEFIVRIGTVEMRDFQTGKPQPTVRKMDLGFEYTVRTVTDFNAAGAEIGGALLVKAAPILLMSALDEAARSAGEGGAGLHGLEKTAQGLIQNLGMDPGVSSNLVEKGAAELQRALKKLF